MPNINSNSYHYIYMIVVVVIVGAGLAATYNALKPYQDKNVELFNKSNILKAVNIPEAGSDATINIEEVYNKTITEKIVNYKGEEMKGENGVTALEVDIAKEDKKPLEERQFPVFVYKDGDKKAYIVPVRGFGLWDAIWGYVAIDDNFKEVKGVAFDHKGETPGLGAEIKDNPSFGEQFMGKQLYRDGEFVSVAVKKPAEIKHPESEVAGISGATFTSVGVDQMIRTDVASYLPYFDKLKNH